MTMKVDEGHSMCAPAFAQHAWHKKRTIHMSMSQESIESTTLIDCGATNNFIYMSFMRKRGIKSKLLETPRICKLGEGVTQITHSFQSEAVIAGGRLPLSFCVMSRKSNQGVVLGYSFLSKNQASIDFGTHEMKLGGIKVACSRKEVVVPAIRHPIYAKINKINSLRESVMIAVRVWMLLREM